MTFPAIKRRAKYFVFSRTRRLLFAALCASTRATVGAQEPAAPPQQQDATTELREMIQHGHAEQALNRLDVLAAKIPEPAGIERLRGLALYTHGDLPAADHAFAAALEQDPQDREAREMRGITLFRIGRPAAAIPLLESLRVAAPHPDAAAPPVDPSYVLALCYLDTRRYADARAAFATQFGFPADSAQSYLLTARMLLRREYVPVAQQFARKALELAPSLPLAHLLLGETELAGNHLDEAVHEFEAERQLSPLEPAVYDRLGDAYVRRGNFDLARQSLQEAVLLEPNSTGPFILLGKVLMKEGNAASASGYLEHARDMDSSNYMTHSLLGQAYRQMGRIEDARRENEMAQKLQSATDLNYAKPGNAKK